MKKLLSVISLLGINIVLFAQSAQYERLMGTWAYQNGDTIFRVQISKIVPCDLKYSKSKYVAIGNYQLSIKGKMVQNYFSDELPDRIAATPKSEIGNVTLYLYYSKYTPDLYALIFYDMEKKHYDMTGIGICSVEVLSPTRIKWTLNELYSWLTLYENSGKEYRPIGFSVPDNAVLIKEP